MATPTTTSDASLAERIVSRLHSLVLEAETNSRPLELDPYRSQLFELFVTAEGAGYLQPDSATQLTADELCRLLGQRFGLTAALRGEGGTDAVASARIHPEQVHQLRLLWSLMRMWMEWTYAWSRWSEFHTAPASSDQPLG
jgi:hypothetical protein